MAAPQLTEAIIKNPIWVQLIFDQPIDDLTVLPSTCFSINYGRIPIDWVEFRGTSLVMLRTGQRILATDKLEVNYQPPDDINLALKGVLPSDASDVLKRRNAVRALFKVPVKNMLAMDETNWAASSNLGGGKRFVPDGEHPDVDVSLPGFDICGDGSVIIGNPNNIININPNGHILEIENLVGGQDYTDGEWDNVYLTGGGAGAEGTRATVGVKVENGVVTAAVLQAGGREYKQGEVLDIAGSSFGDGTGTGGTVTVKSINNLWAQAQAAGVIPGADPMGEGAQPFTDGSSNGSGNSLGGGSGSTKIQDLPYPIAERPTPRAATPDDFVLAYGLREAIQISNIDNADATQPNVEKIWMAIEDSCALIDNYIAGATRAGKILISSSRRRTSLIIARYYLDTVRRREDVKTDYERAITELDKARDLKDITRPELPWWADPCNPYRDNGIRSHRIPQYYNGVSGKGLSGYWNDSGFSEEDDWRYDRDNAESNNDENNWENRGASPRRVPEQPGDDGGTLENTP